MCVLEGLRDELRKQHLRICKTGLHLHLSDGGGVILSVNRTDDWDSLPWAGPCWRDQVRTEQVQRIRAVEVQAHDPETESARWSEVLGITTGGTTVPLDEGEIRFVAVVNGRGEGVSGLELAAARPGDFEISISGVRLSLVAEHA